MRRRWCRVVASDLDFAANREADAELAMSRHQAAAEAALRVTATRAETAKAARVAAAIPLPQPSPVALHPQQQVAQITQDVAPQPAKRPVLARVVSTVTRIPREWEVLGAVGGPIIPREYSDSNGVPLARPAALVAGPVGGDARARGS